MPDETYKLTRGELENLLGPEAVKKLTVRRNLDALRATFNNTTVDQYAVARALLSGERRPHTGEWQRIVSVYISFLMTHERERLDVLHWIEKQIQALQNGR